MHIIDISMGIGKDTIIYPNNPSISMETFKNPGGSSYLSRIVFGSHTGTHIDAPRHVFENGKTIDQFELGLFVGPCRVLDMTASAGAISKKDVLSKNIVPGERILFKTKNSDRGYNQFWDEYIFVSSEAAQYLAEKKVALVGIDYLSIKQRGSKDNTPHTAFLAKNIPIIEGIDLSKVHEGVYFLIALPLKFICLEAAPCRAVLVSDLL